MTVFIRILKDAVDAKDLALKDAIAALREGRRSATIELDPAVFSAVPGSPFAYWISDEIRALFLKFEHFESNDRSVRQGLATADDFRFLRAWWEVSQKDLGNGWFNFAKGGRFSPFYADIDLCVKWFDDGAEIKNNLNEHGSVRSNVWMLRDTSTKYFFRPGLTWPVRARRFAPRPLPAKCIFSHRGYSAFTSDSSLLAALALFNSSSFDFLFKTFLGRFGFPEFLVGVLQKMPWAEPDRELRTTATALARRAWSLKRSSHAGIETSHAFLMPAAVNAIDINALEIELAEIQNKIDNAASIHYGIGPDDRSFIESQATITSPDSDFANELEELDDDSGERQNANDSNEVDAVGSWVVGVAFGRFDPRFATGECAVPAEPEPFDPLPARSPGMYPEREEPVDRPDILVDDEGHADDLATRALAVAERVKVEVPENLRGWLAREFFPLHIKLDSKSRRKAPINWQLAAAAARKSCWLKLND
jgi:hypothetical protein